MVIVRASENDILLLFIIVISCYGLLRYGIDATGFSTLATAGTVAYGEAHFIGKDTSFL